MWLQIEALIFPLGGVGPLDSGGNLRFSREWPCPEGLPRRAPPISRPAGRLLKEGGLKWGRLSDHLGETSWTHADSDTFQGSSPPRGWEGVRICDASMTHRRYSLIAVPI